LEREKLDILWDTCIVQSLTHKEREHTFKWLKTIRNTQDNTITESEKHIFTKMQKLQSNQFTKAPLNLFKGFFIRINLDKGGLGTIECWENDYLYANTCDLIGIDTLWDIALNGEAEVFSIVSGLLNRIFQTVELVPKVKATKVREDYVTLCLNKLTDAAKLLEESSNPDCAKRIERCLAIITGFILG